MRTICLMITCVILILPAGISANTLASLGSGADGSYPVYISGAQSLKAYCVVLEFEGQINDAYFSPGEFLPDPIVIKPRIDSQSGTISFSVAATNGQYASTPDGFLGNLTFGLNSRVEKIRILQIDLVNNDEKIDTIHPPDNSGASGTRLYQNYPNPANPTTTIKFELTYDSEVSLDIYDVAGRLVRSLVNERLEPSQYTIEWNGRDRFGEPVSTGVYFYKLNAGSYAETRKLLILK